MKNYEVKRVIKELVKDNQGRVLCVKCGHAKDLRVFHIDEYFDSQIFTNVLLGLPMVKISDITGCEYIYTDDIIDIFVSK